MSDGRASQQCLCSDFFKQGERDGVQGVKSERGILREEKFYRIASFLGSRKTLLSPDPIPVLQCCVTLRDRHQPSTGGPENHDGPICLLDRSVAYFSSCLWREYTFVFSFSP